MAEHRAVRQVCQGADRNALDVSGQPALDQIYTDNLVPIYQRIGASKHRLTDPVDKRIYTGSQEIDPGCLYYAATFLTFSFAGGCHSTNCRPSGVIQIVQSLDTSLRCQFCLSIIPPYIIVLYIRGGVKSLNVTISLRITYGYIIFPI